MVNLCAKAGRRSDRTLTQRRLSWSASMWLASEIVGTVYARPSAGCVGDELSSFGGLRDFADSDMLGEITVS